jgi:hypothetical protein
MPTLICGCYMYSEKGQNGYLSGSQNDKVCYFNILTSSLLIIIVSWRVSLRMEYLSMISSYSSFTFFRLFSNFPCMTDSFCRNELFSSIFFVIYLKYIKKVALYELDLYKIKMNLIYEVIKCHSIQVYASAEKFARNAML